MTSWGLPLLVLLVALVAVGSGRPAVTALPEVVRNEIEPTATNVTSTSTSSTTEPIPAFNRDRVSLDIPSNLFSSTANLTLRLRDFVGYLITQTSVRIAQVVRLFQPLFGYHLMVDIPKELDV